MVIERSVRVKPGVYRLSAPASPDTPMIVVRGSDLTVDLRGVSIIGMEPRDDPDRAKGIAILIEGGRNVTVRGGRLRGYRFGILARGTRNLQLYDIESSYHWKPRLFSLVEHESLVDWLSFHHNEQREWMRFGASIYLEDVRGGEIRGNRAEQGMNGLLLTRSDSLRIWNNTFSFNSGLGIGLYRSSDNTIMHNHVEYNVRGYSHGFYRRGQDSAGLLIYEQSSRNVVAYNSVTHGGDGLFLWAGQSTMDTGEGGANDNLFFANDFSYAPTNGMEATFSRNTFIANTVMGSDYGLWGGYSFDSKVLGNWFFLNRVGIAIEHGQNNEIARNAFMGDSTAVSLWANPIEPSDWGYPKHRDTRSRDYRVTNNEFERNRVAVRVRNTTGIAVVDNRFGGVDSTTTFADTANVALAGNQISSATDSVSAGSSIPEDLLRMGPKPLAGGLGRVDGSPLPQLPRSFIVVDEWGPYDYRSPKLWPVDSARAIPLRLAVRGPSGSWHVVERRGVARISKESGRIHTALPDTLEVTPREDSRGDWEMVLEYRGSVTRSPRGEELPAGAPYRFSYGRFEPNAEWRVRWFAWSDSTDPRSKSDAFARLLATAPLLEQRLQRLDFMWYRPPKALASLPGERTALEATATVTLKPGAYTLRSISDDAVRVWVDGVLVIDRWTPHESAVDAVRLAGGRHELRVLHYQVDGWTELRVEILRGDPTSSPGSPGPH
jgi:parallel beta-helix repeat protein